MGFLVDCKNEQDPIKDEGARVVTTLFINFSDTQGQLTQKSVRVFPDAGYCVFYSQKRDWDPQKIIMCVLWD